MIDVLILTDMPGPCSPTFAAVGSNVKGTRTQYEVLNIVNRHLKEPGEGVTFHRDGFAISYSYSQRT
jgi:hypothetical protein